MPFGMDASSGSNFLPIVKYNAVAGRLVVVDRVPGSAEKRVTDITNPPSTFAIDFGSLEVGYIKFAANGAPGFVLVPEGSPLPQQPPEVDDAGRPAFKPGFRVKLYGRALGGLREWCSNSAVVVNALDELYQRFRADPHAADGLVPLVTMVGTIPVSFGKGAGRNTLYAPALRIDRWVDRVPQFGERTVRPPSSAITKTSATAETNEPLEETIPL